MKYSFLFKNQTLEENLNEEVALKREPLYSKINLKRENIPSYFIKVVCCWKKEGLYIIYLIRIYTNTSIKSFAVSQVSQFKYLRMRNNIPFSFFSNSFSNTPIGGVEKMRKNCFEVVLKW